MLITSFFTLFVFLFSSSLFAEHLYPGVTSYISHSCRDKDSILEYAEYIKKDKSHDYANRLKWGLMVSEGRCIISRPSISATLVESLYSFKAGMIQLTAWSVDTSYGLLYAIFDSYEITVNDSCENLSIRDAMYRFYSSNKFTVLENYLRGWKVDLFMEKFNALSPKTDYKVDTILLFGVDNPISGLEKNIKIIGFKNDCGVFRQDLPREIVKKLLINKAI